MEVIASFCFAFLFAAISPAAEPHSPTATGSTESLAALARKVRPDFLLGSFASGLDFTRPGNPPLADGKDGQPLMLDKNLQPKPAYLRQVEMLRTLVSHQS